MRVSRKRMGSGRNRSRIPRPTCRCQGARAIDPVSKGAIFSHVYNQPVSLFGLGEAGGRESSRALVVRHDWRLGGSLALPLPAQKAARQESRPPAWVHNAPGRGQGCCKMQRRSGLSERFCVPTRRPLGEQPTSDAYFRKPYGFRDSKSDLSIDLA
jgi:hypothetical protein